MATRVYDLSKKYNISNKEMLELLKEHGFSLSNIAVVPDNAIILVDKIFSQRTPKKAPEIEKQHTEETVTPKIKKQSIQPREELPPQKPEPVMQPQIKKTSEIPRKPEQPKQVAAQQVTSPVAAPKRVVEPEEPVQPEIVLAPMTVADIAHKARKQVSDVILTLLKQGVVANKNQLLPEKTIAQLAEVYNIKIVKKSVAQPVEEKKTEIATEGVWQERLPVVVVIGHVDHGKTTLLDFIRKTRVAAKEKGGITQHLGAYEVKTGHGNIVFLDTPGHAAFSLMRARGIKVADIAILVVAADDGIMPQTVEAIARAKAAGLPIVVALNKIDKATPAQVETAKRQLAQHDLVPEEWGGQVVVLPISAKLGTGIDALLDVIILQSQLMDLKANLSIPARGYVLESKIEKGRGPVATVICQHGKLHVGDYFIAGATSGKVSSLVDSSGKRLNEVGPSIPVQVAGFSELPQAGDSFEVSTQEAVKKGISEFSKEPKSDIYLKKAQGDNEIALIVKADNASSREALVNSLSKMESDHRKVTIIVAGIGDISESDIMLAADTGSLIYGFHVKIGGQVLDLAHKKGVTVKSFDIIYKLIEDVEQLLESGKPIKMVSKKIGEASVLKVFDIKGLGIVAGAHARTGRFTKDGKVLIWRGKQKVGEGTIKGLQRDRKAVKEVHAGFECAFLVDGFDTWEVDDRVECFQEVPVS